MADTGDTLFSAVIADICSGLESSVPWLDHAYGRAWRIRRRIGGRDVTLPAVYTGGESRGDANDYTEVTPDARCGCFSFFLLDDPQTVEWCPGQPGPVSSPFSLIVWTDLRQVYRRTDCRDTEGLKAELLDRLNGRIRIRTGRIRITRIYERAENIYRGFTLDEVDSQFLMHPYWGCRLEGTMTAIPPCLR